MKGRRTLPDESAFAYDVVINYTVARGVVFIAMLDALGQGLSDHTVSISNHLSPDELLGMQSNTVTFETAEQAQQQHDRPQRDHFD